MSILSVREALATLFGVANPTADILAMQTKVAELYAKQTGVQPVAAKPVVAVAVKPSVAKPVNVQVLYTVGHDALNLAFEEAKLKLMNAAPLGRVLKGEVVNAVPVVKTDDLSFTLKHLGFGGGAMWVLYAHDGEKQTLIYKMANCKDARTYQATKVRLIKATPFGQTTDKVAYSPNGTWSLRMVKGGSWREELHQEAKK
jgi:hypothetical protein